MNSVDTRDMRRALIVEDEMLFQDQIDLALDETGFTWRSFKFFRAADAITFMNDTRSPLDIALIDLGLPDKNGIEVIKSVRARFANCPILVITVVTSKETLRNALLSGATGYLLKDSETEEISLNIKNALKGHAVLSPILIGPLIKLFTKDSKENHTHQLELSHRELELLQNIYLGLTYEECAHKMQLSLHTIHSYSKKLFRKLDAKSKTQAIQKAINAGYLHNQQ